MNIAKLIGNWLVRLVSPPNTFTGLAKANSVAQLAVLRQNAQVQHAAHVRLMSKMLGVPPNPLEEDPMLAGGDIKINGNIGPWILAATVLVLAAIMLSPYLPKTEVAATPQPQGVAVPNTQWSAAPFDPFAQPAKPTSTK